MEGPPSNPDAEPPLTATGPGRRPDWLVSRLIGHRGAAACAPENTLAGIARAAAAGIGMVELDVKLSADGVPILMHDDMLERTTNGTGPVAEAPFARLRKLDAGGWFAADYAGEAVPTLADALSLLYSLGLSANIEIKPCPGRATETALRTVDTLAALWPAGRPLPLVSSFSADALFAVRGAAPDMPVAVLVDQTNDAPGRDWALLAARLGAASVNVEVALLLGHGVARYRVGDAAVIAWSVNDPDDARRLFDAGADAVITDDPARLAAALPKSASAAAPSGPRR